MSEHALTLRGGIAPKLHAHHLLRLALGYVRQSHAQQVAAHVASTARQ
jgi:hypothetical protein